jgi:muramidase (phage lysozyme)
MDVNLKKFLDLIAWSEGTSTSPITCNDGYDVLVSGIHGAAIFTDYSDHPFAHGGSVMVRPGLSSTAAGRYQLLSRYWKVYRENLGLSDFSPASQDAVAVQQIKERGALPLIEAGDIQGAIEKCANIWASLPGNTYAQGGHTMQDLLAQYTALSELSQGVTSVPKG